MRCVAVRSRAAPHDAARHRNAKHRLQCERMKAFWVQMINLDLFFRYLKGRCHGNQFCGKMANSVHVSLWHSETEWDIATSMCALTAAMAFNNRLADREAAFKRLNGNTPATSCTNLIYFCAIISKFTLLKRAIFAALGRNLKSDRYSSPWRSKRNWNVAIWISGE